MLKDGFETVHKDLLLSDVTSAEFSGTTLCTVLLRGRSLFAANAGDSRAIMITTSGEVFQLTKDNKPDDPAEKARIESHGGRVKPMSSKYSGKDIGPDRVWLPSHDAPGLAMSRSIGDFQVHTAGVIAEPEVTEYKL
jgi:serine/threonine protein phosphatase PrpC